MLKLNVHMTEEQMCDYITAFINGTPTFPGLQSFFYFEEEPELKLMTPVYVSKLAELIHKNLATFKERGWNAVVHIEDGIVHVFFGNNNGILEIPQILRSGVVGTC